MCNSTPVCAARSRSLSATSEAQHPNKTPATGGQRERARRNHVSVYKAALPIANEEDVHKYIDTCTYTHKSTQHRGQNNQTRGVWKSIYFPSLYSVSTYLPIYLFTLAIYPSIHLHNTHAHAHIQSRTLTYTTTNYSSYSSTTPRDSLVFF